MRENTDGSEVEGFGRVWMGCVSMVCSVCPQISWSFMCPSRPYCPVPLVLHTALCPHMLRRKGVEYLGRVVTGKARCCDASGLSSAALSLSSGNHTSGWPHSALLFAPISREIPGARAPFPSIHVMDLEDVAYSGCHHFFKYRGTEGHSPVHRADQGDALLCIDLVEQVKQHTGFLKMSWSWIAFKECRTVNRPEFFCRLLCMFLHQAMKISAYKLWLSLFGHSVNFAIAGTLLCMHLSLAVCPHPNYTF